MRSIFPPRFFTNFWIKSFLPQQLIREWTKQPDTKHLDSKEALKTGTR